MTLEQHIPGSQDHDHKAESADEDHKHSFFEVTAEVCIPEEPDDIDGKKRFSWRTLWAYSGPGWLMSVSATNSIDHVDQVYFLWNPDCVP